MKALLTIADFTSAYGVSRATVYRLVEKGDLNFVHIGRAVRLRTEEVEIWYRNLGHRSEGVR